MLVALLMGVGSAQALAAPAIVTIDPAPTASYATAHVSGMVDPLGNESTFYSFEYSTDETTWSAFAYEGIVSTATAGPQNVSAELTGLKGATHYSVRLVTFNFEEFVDSAEPNPAFTTLAVAKPVVLSTADASAVSYLTASVSGSVERPANADPAFDASCRFEYVSSGQFSASEFQGATQAPCDTNPVTAPGSSAVTAQLTGLAPATTYHLRLTASNAGGSNSRQAAHTFTTLAVAEPAVTIAEASNITTSSAHLAGTINPGGSDPLFGVSWHFQCTPECPGLEGSLPPDSNPHAVEADATGLAPNTAYEVNLLAANTINQATAGPNTFSTLQSPPAATTGPGLTPSADATELTGTVNPYGLQTSYYFEYGPTAAYGTTVPATLDGVAGDGRSPRAVTRRISGLQPNSTYHYRLIATSSAGSTQGADTAFTTEGPPSPSGRAYEQVSPVEKHGIPVATYPDDSGIFRASPDGNSIRYIQFSAPDAAAGSPYYVKSIAARASSGWSSTNINLPYSNPSAEASNPFFNTVVAVSEDLSHTAAVSNEKLTPDAVEGQWSLYRTDNATGARVLLATDPGLKGFTNFGPFAAEVFVGASSDARTVVYEDAAGIVEATEGKGTRAVSIMPDGTPTTDVGAGPAPSQRDTHPVSSDGSRVYWCVVPHNHNGFTGTCSVWYLRSNVSEPQSALAPAPTATGDIDGGIGSGDLTAGSVTLTNVNTASGAFAVGQTISDHQHLINGGTTILAVGPGTLTLSQEAFGNVTGDELSAFSKTITNFTPTQGAFQVGAEVIGHGIPIGTVVESAGPGTLTLSSFPTEPGSALTIASVGACTEPTKACTIRIPVPENMFLLGASLDGRFAEFGVINNDANGRIYRFDAATGTVTDIGPGASGNGSEAIAVPDHGEFYTVGYPPTLSRVHDGISTQIAVGGTDAMKVSANGRYLDFASGAQQTSFNSDGKEEIYLYDSQSESLVCASCRRDGGPAFGDAQIGQREESEYSEGWWVRSVTDDGTVFFDTPDPLVAADVNGARDVYSYHAGHITLITPGTGPGSEFAEVTPDGSNVYFVTEAALVSQDRDGILDLYDARVGGGLASQNPVAAPECAGEGCRGVTAVPPPPALAASESLSDVGNLKLLAAAKPVVKKAKPVKCRKGFVRKHSKCVKVKAKKKAGSRKAAGKKANINRRVK